MKTKLFLLLVLVCAASSCQKKSQEEIAKANLEMCQKLENEIFACVAYVEDFGKGRDSKRFEENARSKPYFCGAKWTTGYGSTVYPKGTTVKKTNKPISKSYAKECAIAHLQKRVFPFICKYVTRELSETEMLGTCMFVYNIGGENFSGFKQNGEKFGNPSSFLQALNKGESAKKCARKMTGFRGSNGKRANGLLKRHWVQAAVFCGYITPEDLLKLKPSGFYQIKELNHFYEKDHADKDGYFTYKHDKKSIEWFKSQEVEKNTLLILDKNTQSYFLAKK